MKTLLIGMTAFAVTATAAAADPQSSANNNDYDKAAAEMAAALGNNAVKTTTPLPSSAPDGYDKLVRGWLAGYLKDPYSAVVTRVKGPTPTSFKPDVWTRVEGQAVCYDVNAKNSYGGYTGAQRYLFVVTEGAISYQISQADHRQSSFAEGIIRSHCGA